MSTSTASSLPASTRQSRSTAAWTTRSTRPFLGAHDDPPVAQPNTSPQKLRAVAGASRRSGTFREQPRPAAGRPPPRVPARPRARRRRSRRSAGAEREGESERTTAGEEQPLAGRNPMHLRDRLRGAGGQHARKRPAREGDRAVGRRGQAGHGPPRPRAHARPRRRAPPRCRAARCSSSGSGVAPGGPAASIQRPSTPVIPAERAVVLTVSPAAKICPPRVGRSSARATEQPSAAAWAAAASPAGRPDHEQVVRLGVAHRRGRPGGGARVRRVPGRLRPGTGRSSGPPDRRQRALAARHWRQRRASVCS